MPTFIDSIILFILCSICYPADKLSAFHIMSILLLLALYCFEYTAGDYKTACRIGIITLTMCFFVPELSVFVPFYCYIFFYRKQYLLPFLFILPLLPYFYQNRSYVNWGILLLAALSFYLARGNNERNHLKRMIHTFRDNSVEKEMILRHANEQLIENQNDQIYIATLKERNRIAREIHDNVGHMLSRSILQVGALLATCRDESVKPYLENLKETLDEAMNNIRNSVHDLHDESIDLHTALNNLVESFTFCPVRLVYDVTKRIPKEVKYCFLAITKEAFNNIIKHSNASHVTIMVKEHPGFYQLLIEDNGTKCSAALSATGSNASLNTSSFPSGSGIGLSNMKDRVAALNGILRITTDNGFRIFVSIKK